MNKHFKYKVSISTTSYGELEIESDKLLHTKSEVYDLITDEMLQKVEWSSPKLESMDYDGEEGDLDWEIEGWDKISLPILEIDEFAHWDPGFNGDLNISDFAANFPYVYKYQNCFFGTKTPLTGNYAEIHIKEAELFEIMRGLNCKSQDVFPWLSQWHSKYNKNYKIYYKLEEG